MTPVFPDRMTAGCANGHHWIADITWTPMQLELPPECGTRPVEHIQMPTTISPRYCAQCFLDRRPPQPALFLRHLPVGCSVEGSLSPSASSVHTQASTEAS